MEPPDSPAVSITPPRRPTRGRLAVACLVWLCGARVSPAQPVAAPAAPFPEDYLMVIEACRGETMTRRLCAESLRSWTAERLAGALAGIRAARAQAQGAPDAARVDDSTLAFAALVHTDLAFDALGAQDQAAARAHLDLAGGLLGLLPDTTAVPELKRRWTLAVGCRYRRDFALDEARAWLGAALARYPDDPRLLLALGSADELTATYRNPVCPTSAECPTASERERYTRVEWDRRSYAASAAHLYTRALAADPALIEARLRLARVLWLHVSKPRGRDALTEVAQQPQPEDLAYLTQLFLGAALDEDGPQRPEALAHYRAALALRPGGQAAHLALAQALRRSGDLAAAHEALAPLLAPAATLARGGAAADPWWAYAAGPGVCDAEAWSELRREAGL